METIKGVESLNLQTEQGKTSKEDTVDELIERVTQYLYWWNTV